MLVATLRKKGKEAKCLDLQKGNQESFGVCQNLAHVPEVEEENQVRLFP